MQKKQKSAVSQFDLNLMSVFDTVYRLNSVTKAAEAMGHAPSSVSQSLHKLREFFSDPLFVRAGSGLAPTATATDVHRKLSEKYDSLIASLEDLSQTSSKNLLIIQCHPYVGLRMMPAIAWWMEQNAPCCKIVHRELVRCQNTPEDLLLQRGVNLVLDVLPAYNLSLETHRVLEEQAVFVCRERHPRLGSCITREEAALERFSMLDSSGIDIQRFQVHINKSIGERNFAIKSSSLMTILSVIEATDVVGVIPVWLYERLKGNFKVRTLTQAFSSIPIPIYMMFNKSSLKNEMFTSLTTWLEKHFHEGGDTLGLTQDAVINN